VVTTSTEVQPTVTTHSINNDDQHNHDEEVKVIILNHGSDDPKNNEENDMNVGEDGHEQDEGDDSNDAVTLLTTNQSSHHSHIITLKMMIISLNGRHVVISLSCMDAITKWKASLTPKEKEVNKCCYFDTNTVVVCCVGSLDDAKDMVDRKDNTIGLTPSSTEALSSLLVVGRPWLCETRHVYDKYTPSGMKWVNIMGEAINATSAYTTSKRPSRPSREGYQTMAHFPSHRLIKLTHFQLILANAHIDGCIMIEPLTRLISLQHLVISTDGRIDIKHLKEFVVKLCHNQPHINLISISVHCYPRTIVSFIIDHFIPPGSLIIIYAHTTHNSFIFTITDRIYRPIFCTVSVALSAMRCLFVYGPLPHYCDSH
jgi:hypothetical protein